jgi:hypothetical protein
MKPQLFLTNIPHNRSDREVQEWVESRGIKVRSVRVFRAPAFGYVELNEDEVIGEAVMTLNGKKMRNQTIVVREAALRLSAAASHRDRSRR